MSSRKQNRGIFILKPLLVLLLAVAGISAPASNEAELVLYKRLRQHETCDWRIPLSRALATPVWDIESSIPLEPERAWRTAREWLAKRGITHPEFVKMEIRPFVPASEETRLDEGLKRRFYYVIDCSPEHLAEGKKADYMSAIVLLDGSVLEPITKPL